MSAVKFKAVALAAAAILMVAACGSSVAKPTDPVGGVAAAFDIAKAGGTLKKMALTSCLISGTSSLGSSSLFSSFSSMSQSSLNAQGITTDDLNGAVQVSFDGLSSKEVTRSGGSATVHVEVKISVHVDASKMRDVFKKTLGSTGVIPDDATIDAQVKTSLNGQFDQSVTISKDISVSLQNDTWVACGSDFAYPAPS